MLQDITFCLSSVESLANWLWCTYSLLSSKVFHSQLKLSLFLPGLGDGCLVLFLIGHGHHSQDQVDQIEGAQEDYQHKENHVGLPC